MQNADMYHCLTNDIQGEELMFNIVQVSAERDSSNQANIALKAELDRYRDVTGNTVEALEREKAVKAQLETQNKAQVR